MDLLQNTPFYSKTLHKKPVFRLVASRALYCISWAMAKREVSSDTARPLANARREKFAQLIADGVKPSEAYKKAYKCSSVVAMASVSRMLGYADVKGRIEYLQSQIADNKAERRRKKLAVCESIWSGEVAEAAVSDRLRAIDIDNKMCGDYEAVKVDLGEVGDVLAGLVISASELEEAAAARRECFAKIRKRQEVRNG